MDVIIKELDISRILEYVPAQSPSDLPRDIYSKIVKSEPVYGYPLTGYRCAIDSPTRYEMANNAVKSGEYKLGEWEYE